MPVNRLSHKISANTPILAEALEHWHRKLDRKQLVQQDPLELVHRYPEPHDQEVAGLLVAALAYGRVQSIKKAADAALSVLGARPAHSVDRGRIHQLDGFVYRFQKEDDLLHFLVAVGSVRRHYGSLAKAFAHQVADEDASYAPAARRFVGELRGAMEASKGATLSYGLRYLLPDPGSGAAKRLWLYLRWMIRGPDPMDLGTWRVLAPDRLLPSKLIVPIDTHVARIGRYLGLTERRTDDLKTAIEMTQALAQIDPEDPVRFDMALCHLGISGQCPRELDLGCCAVCPVRAICARPGGGERSELDASPPRFHPNRADVGVRLGAGLATVVGDGQDQKEEGEGQKAASTCVPEPSRTTSGSTGGR